MSDAVQVIEAEPLTGRTHQIRAHASHSGFPVLGDSLYGGKAASRLCLHARKLTLKCPVSGEELDFTTEPNFQTDARLALRKAVINPSDTDSFRLIHGASDGWPGWYVDKLGDFLLSQGELEPRPDQKDALTQLMSSLSARGVYHKLLTRRTGKTGLSDASPRHLLGELAPERFTIKENGVHFELSFAEGYSVGLFLDQRDNRRRLLKNHVAARFDTPSSGAGAAVTVLNAFAYTCGFSICAARAGARTTSLDLSKKYLEWGKRNFELNGLNPIDHEFIYGDVFDWLRRLDKKGRRFDVVLLDPPTFSHSKEYGSFRVEKDYGELTKAALKVLKPGGVLFASTNAADWAPEKFLAALKTSITDCERNIAQSHYVPQPLDFPVSRDEPAYLKTVWLRID